MRRIAPVLVPLALFLAACGAAGPTAGGPSTAAEEPPPVVSEPARGQLYEANGMRRPVPVCTPGMLISATVLLQARPRPTEEEIRIALSGNLRRCTGYDGIAKAVLAVASAGEP